MSLGIEVIWRGFASALPVFFEQFWTRPVEQLLDFVSILDGFFDGRYHGLGHVHGGAASLIAQG